jgi:hypothetical protein
MTTRARRTAWLRCVAVALTDLGLLAVLLPWACPESTPTGGTRSRPIFPTPSMDPGRGRIY